MKNAPLIASLRFRGLTQEALAARIGSRRAHVCQVLNNVPGRGGRTRKKLAPWLTLEELDLLDWTTDGHLVFPVERSKFSTEPNNLLSVPALAETPIAVLGTPEEARECAIVATDRSGYLAADNSFPPIP